MAAAAERAGFVWRALAARYCRPQTSDALVDVRIEGVIVVSRSLSGFPAYAGRVVAQTQ